MRLLPAESGICLLVTGECSSQGEKVVKNHRNVSLIRVHSDEEIILPATDGRGTFMNSLRYGIRPNPNFKKYGLDMPGRPAPEMPVNMFEMYQHGGNGTYAQIFGVTGVDPEGLRISQAKAESFGPGNRDKLHPQGWSTLMLITRGDEPVNERLSNLFVAHVRVRNGRLSASPYEFTDDRVLDAIFRFRLVIREPQFIIPQTR